MTDRTPGQIIYEAHGYDVKWKDVPNLHDRYEHAASVAREPLLQRIEVLEQKLDRCVTVLEMTAARITPDCFTGQQIQAVLDECKDYRLTDPTD